MNRKIILFALLFIVTIHSTELYKPTYKLISNKNNVMTQRVIGFSLLKNLYDIGYNIDTYGISSKKETLTVKYDPIHKLLDFSGRIMHNDVKFQVVAYNSDSMFIGRSNYEFNINTAYINQDVVDSAYLHYVSNFKVNAVWPNGNTYLLTEKLYCTQNDKKLIQYVDTNSNVVLTCRFDKSYIKLDSLYNPHILDTLFGNIIPVYHQRKTCNSDQYWKYDSVMNTCIEKAYCFEGRNEHYDASTNECFTIPKHSHLTGFGKRWMCDDGYVQIGNSCHKHIECDEYQIYVDATETQCKSIPENSTKVSTYDYRCDDGYELNVDNFENESCIKLPSSLYQGIALSIPTTLGVVTADESKSITYDQVYYSMAFQIGYEFGYLKTQDNKKSIGLRASVGILLGVSDISAYSTEYYDDYDEKEEIARIGVHIDIGVPIRVNSLSLYGFFRPFRAFPGYKNHLYSVQDDDSFNAGLLIGFNHNDHEVLFGFSNVDDMHFHGIFSFEAIYTYLW